MNKTTKNTISKEQYKNGVAKNMGYSFSNYNKLEKAKKVELTQKLADLKIKPTIKDDIFTLKVDLTSEQVAFFRYFISAKVVNNLITTKKVEKEAEAITNNDLKKFIPRAILSAFETDLKTTEKNKTFSLLEYVDNIKATKFYKKLNEIIYFSNKRIEKDALTKQYKSINL